jgi:hypothetical protein
VRKTGSILLCMYQRPPRCVVFCFAHEQAGRTFSCSVQKTPSLRHLYTKQSFYHDRLRTNLGKTQKRVAFCAAVVVDVLGMASYGVLVSGERQAWSPRSTGAAQNRVSIDYFIRRVMVPSLSWQSISSTLCKPPLKSQCRHRAIPYRVHLRLSDG